MENTEWYSFRACWISGAAVGNFNVKGAPNSGSPQSLSSILWFIAATAQYCELHHSGVNMKYIWLGGLIKNTVDHGKRRMAIIDSQLYSSITQNKKLLEGKNN